MTYININGRLLIAQEAGIVPDSRAFRYGYGLFETMLFRDGRIALAAYHWERLFAGMAQLYIEAPRHFNTQLLEAEVLRTVRKNKLEHLCRIRLQVWPGSGGLYDATSFAPQFAIECFPLAADFDAFNENGLVAGIAAGLHKSMDRLAALKSTNALIYSVAARQAKAERWNDALILNTHNRIIESTIANVFWISGSVIHTPNLEEGCINGVMRRRLIDCLQQKNILFSEQPLTREALAGADEVFLTNAIRKIKWISRLGDIAYGCERARELAWLLASSCRDD